MEDAGTASHEGPYVLWVTNYAHLRTLLQRGHSWLRRAANVIWGRLELILRRHTFWSLGLSLLFCWSSGVFDAATMFFMYFVNLFRCAAKASVRDMFYHASCEDELAG